jgi:cell shape-determining protein MreD
MPKSRVAIILLLAANLAAPAVAQTVTGTILGLATDPSGAVVPGSTVTVAGDAAEAGFVEHPEQ